MSALATADALLDEHGTHFTTSCMGACPLYRRCRIRHAGQLVTVIPPETIAILPASVTTFTQILDLAGSTNEPSHDQSDLAAALTAAHADLVTAANLASRHP